ncbi:MAG: class I SAM-dependent methyltransferase [Thermoanaerobaculia bacterium]
MSHRAGGVYKILERPGIYQRFQSLLGGPGALERFVREFVRPADGARVLDVACGTGALLQYLPESVQYVGYDLNPDYIDAARRRYGSRGRFVCARVGEEPDEIATGTFDVVVAVAVLHHLSETDADHLLRMAARTLSSAGSCVTIDPTLHAGQGFISKTLARLDRGGAVRSPESYRGLFQPHFEHVEQWLMTDMLAIPYSHCILRGVPRCL